MPDEQNMTAKAAGLLAYSFRQRLMLALAALAAIAALQGGFAIWAVGMAEHHVQRGRVAADIQQGYTELWLDKMRLRNWLAQMQFGANADLGLRDGYLAAMRANLARLNELSDRARTLDDDPLARERQAKRRDSLIVLSKSLDQLERGMAKLNKPPADRDTSTAWRIANELFDSADGRDMRSLLADSLVREAVALREKRADTDASLAWLRTLWLGSTLALVAFAILLAVILTRALQEPLARLVEGAAALREGRLSHRISLAGQGEFSDVASSMNSMAEELAAHRAREAEARQDLEEQVARRTAELRLALDQRQEIEARRRQLFADISHELRTPATAIRGEAQVALRGKQKPVEEYQRSLQRIEDVSRQLGITINDLLTMARSDIDMLSLHRVPIDLGDVLDDVVTSGEAIARSHGQIVTHDPWPPDLVMLGDADRLRQMFLALLDNAVRYSRPGQSVHMTAERADDDKQIRVMIADNGIGIAGENLSMVFERGQRTPDAVAHSREGSGLGLPIARTLVRSHGGDIRLVSHPGQGTTATVTLPMHDPEATDPR